MNARRTPEVEAFWAASGIAAPRYDVVAFGTTPEFADWAAAEVLAGRKRATAMLERDVMSGAETPQIGGHVVIVDGSNRPVCITRTVELRLGPLVSVDEAFCRDEGEGDLSRETWLRNHRDFFGALAARDGFALTDATGVVFERFALVWAPG
ncbi:MAG: ASCH domain-containing protein [Acetobacteraceae bacterium]|nr:ASCH domain-containing protein [Acetobacteraceae bacterium]